MRSWPTLLQWTRSFAKLRLSCPPAKAVRASRIGAAHERVVTGSGRAAASLPQVRAINTFLGNLKRSLGGTYHAFDFAKYAHRYLAEAQYRFNRRFDLSSVLQRLLRAAVLTPPTPDHAIRRAEVRR
jgi:hypothetical protein